jgi:rhodanese-related sulfurtransferase
MRTNILGIFIVMLGLLTFNSCAEGQPSKGENLSAAQFKESIEKGDVTILDVRTAGEVGSGYIDGAENIDWYASDFKERVAKLDKAKPVYIYCASGGRSSSALSTVKALGFKNVYHLEGGMGAWRKAGYPVKK